MGMFGGRSRANHDGPAIPVTSSNSSLSSKRKWTNLMPLLVAIVVIAEIAFLGRLDVTKNSAVVDSFADLFHRTNHNQKSAIDEPAGRGVDLTELRSSELDGCEAWLEREDSVQYDRDFDKQPIRVSGADQEWNTCAVGCQFGFENGKNPDAALGVPQPKGTASVLRSMESAQYYSENDLATARGKGYQIVMTTSLSSDVPVGYFSWAEYDIMAPVLPKTEKALAAAFISNCGARNFRLQALEALEKANVQIDSYGGCHRNRNEKVDKVEALRRYKFSLAFENSNEEDYVTEKFFQSLVAGSVPIVIGPPNIQEFAPAPGSILYIKELSDVDTIAKTMKYLSEDPEAYNKTLRWKYEGPSDSFKALVDMAAVHSSCRLCIHLATAIRAEEEKKLRFKNRPCKCTRGSSSVYHLYIRERGRFEMESIFLRSDNLTLEALESAVLAKFNSKKHVPIWKKERPESIRGGDELKVYRIYPVGMTQRQALYTFRFKGDDHFRSHVDVNPCAKFEVIFV